VKGSKTQTSNKEGRESKNQGTTGSTRGVWQRKFRSPGEKECKREKNDGEIRCGNEERENSYWIEGKERRCRMCDIRRERHRVSLKIKK
jgi:hypothetical protein